MLKPVKRALSVAALACAYYATGTLGLLLAVPPGYATIIWPPSGIAIGSLLLFGARLWPGIFVGSFVLNGFVAHAWTLSGDFVLTKALIAAGIATGSTLQALGVRVLIQRCMRLPIELSSWRDLSLLLGLCGPVGCVIAPTCGMLTLTLGGALPPDTLLHNWLTWWAGDLFGVVVFLPLMLILPGAPTRLRWRGQGVGALSVAGLLILLLSLGLTFYAWRLVAHFVYEKNNSQFAALAQESATALLHRIDTYEHVLLGGMGFFRSTGSVSRAQWRTYIEADDIPRNYPGIRGIGWITDVPAPELAKFAQDMRRQGQPDFVVHPVGSYPDHFIISYIEPIELNHQAIGLNIAFEHNRYSAALLARKTRTPVITRPISLVQALSGGPSFLMLVPIYDTSDPLGSAQPGEGRFRGWIFAAFAAQSFLTGLTNSQGQTLHLRVYDEQEEPESLVYDSNAGGERHEPSFKVRKVLNVRQRRWILSWESTAGFEAGNRDTEPTLVLVSGVLLTFLLGGIMMMLAHRAETVEQLVRRKTQQLIENEERYQTLVDGVTDYAIYRLDAGGCVRSWSTGAQLVEGYGAQEILGRHFSHFFSKEDQAKGEPARILGEAARLGHYATESWRLRKDGTRFWATAVTHALRNARGNLIGFARVVRDATQRHELEQLKSEFISTVSHELRTPLTSIRGSLGLLEAGVLGKMSEQAQSMIKIAHQNSQRLVRIINDILDIERIESGKLELRLESLAVAPLLRHALEVNEGYGHKYQVRFVLQTAPEQVSVRADSDRLQQVMSNLLSNAAKFSPAGAEVRVRATSTQDRVRFEVEDHGTGIPEEFRGRIFEKFAQADASASRRFDGTGLGLSITRQLIEAMAGTIGFNTVVGQGTTFYFELPS